MTMEREIRKLRKERKKDNRDWDATWCHCNEKTHNSSLWGKELAFVTTKFLIFDSLRVSWRYALEVGPSPLRVCWNLYNRPYKLEILQHRGKIYQNMAKSFNFSLFLTAQYRQEALLFFVPAFVEVEALQVHTLLHWIATFTHLKSHMVAEVKNWEPEVVCCLTLFNGKSTQKVIVVSCHLLGQSFLHAGLPYTTVRFGKLMSVARLLVQFCWYSLIAFSFVFCEAQPLLIACLCGALAGACGAITSHPIDTLFALRTTGVSLIHATINQTLQTSTK